MSSFREIPLVIQRTKNKAFLQVPPDFYIPDFDEDEQNPDERVDRKWNFIDKTPFPASAYLFAHKFSL